MLEMIVRKPRRERETQNWASGFLSHAGKAEILLLTGSSRITVGQNNQEYRLKYWATRSSVLSFARTAHSFACSELLASLTPPAALTPSLPRSLCSLPRSWESELSDGYFVCDFFHCRP